MLLDDIYSAIGDVGPYQAGLYITLMIMALPTAWNHVAIAFMGAEVDHWCRVPELANLSAQQQRYISAPLELGVHSKCYMYDIEYSKYTPEEFLAWDREAMLDNGTGVSYCKHGWMYDHSIFTSTAMTEWDLVCEDRYRLALIQTGYMAGVLVGCLIFGQLSDSIGRMKTILISSIIWVIAALVAAFVPNYLAFVVSRFVVGAADTGAFTTAFVMSMEMIGPRYRMETGIFVQGWFALGIMSLAGIAYFVRDMRQLQIIIGVTPAIFIFYYCFVPESPRWLISQKQDAQAEKVFKTMAKLNRGQVPSPLGLEDNRRQDSSTTDNANVMDLFRYRNLRAITICMWIAWFATSVVYYGLSLGVSFLQGSLFFNVFLTGVVELPAYVVSIIALKRLGRRWSTVISSLGAGVCCLLHIPFLLQGGNAVALICLMMLGKASGSAAFAILYLYAAELFPTVLRNVGVGSSSMMARFGGLLQPQFALTSALWAPLPFVVYGVLSIVGGLICLYFPETLGRRLPETLLEAENFRKNKDGVITDMEAKDATDQSLV